MQTRTIRFISILLVTSLISVASRPVPSHAQPVAPDRRMPITSANVRNLDHHARLSASTDPTSVALTVLNGKAHIVSVESAPENTTLALLQLPVIESELPRSEDDVLNDVVSPDWTRQSVGYNVTSIDYTADGRLAVIGTDQGEIVVLESGREIDKKSGYSGKIHVSISTDDSTVVSTDSGRIFVWALSDAGKLTTRAELTGFTNQSTLAVNFDGQLVAYGDDNDIVVKTVSTDGAAFTLKGHQSPVNALAFSPDGSLLVSTSVEDKGARAWNVNTRQPITILKQLQLRAQAEVIRFDKTGRYLGEKSFGSIWIANIVDYTSGIFSPDDHCGNGRIWQFVPGDQGRVGIDAARTPSTLRDKPGGNRLQSIPAGENFVVLDGPVCTSQNGISWWQVKLSIDGSVGWFSEGNAERYFLDYLGVDTFSDYTGGAACPHIFTYDPVRGEYAWDTTILTDLNEKAKETTQSQPLQRFNGTLQIRELEYETSYIDYVAVEVHDSIGNWTTFTANPVETHSQLSAIDGSYWIMNRGDTLSLTFDGYDAYAAAHTITEIRIVSHGYYVPYTLQ